MHLADNCTGEDIVAAIRAEAERRGITAHALVRTLSSEPSKWLSQVVVARRPKLHTVQRVRALLAGEVDVPVPPRVKTRRNIVRRVITTRAAPEARPAPSLAPAGTSRPAALRAEVFAETATTNFRRWVAQSTGSVANPLPVDRPATVERFAVAGDDRRPFAAGREPCLRCGARGDLGCRHQRPDPEIQGLDPP